MMIWPPQTLLCAILLLILGCNLPIASAGRPLVTGQGRKEEGQCADDSCRNDDESDRGRGAKEEKYEGRSDIGRKEVPADKQHSDFVLTAESDFPDGWQEYTYMDIRDHFDDCSYHSGDNDKALPTLERWQFMQRTFTDVVDKSKKWNDPVPPTLGYSLRPGIPVPPPYYPQVSPGKGRGLFASRDIKEGEVVHDGTHSDVVFPTALSWRRYVFSLPRDMACDCTDWHWMQKVSNDDNGDNDDNAPLHMVGGINVSSLMNSGGDEYGDERTPNALPRSSSSGKFHATRDIKQGEEILTDYYAYDTDFWKIGL